MEPIIFSNVLNILRSSTYEIDEVDKNNTIAALEYLQINYDDDFIISHSRIRNISDIYKYIKFFFKKFNNLIYLLLLTIIIILSILNYYNILIINNNKIFFNELESLLEKNG